MVNITKIVQGVGLFLGFYIAAIILNLISPLILNTLTVMTANYFDSTGLMQMAWTTIIMIWTIGITIIPSAFIIQGIQETEEGETNAILNVAFAIGIVIFSLIFTLKGWFMFEALAAATTNVLITGLFWIGLALIWIEITIITPIFIVMDALKK
jgi:hypothetical protein